MILILHSLKKLFAQLIVFIIFFHQLNLIWVYVQKDTHIGLLFLCAIRMYSDIRSLQHEMMTYSQKLLFRSTLTNYAFGSGVQFVKCSEFLNVNEFYVFILSSERTFKISHYWLPAFHNG